MTDQDNLRDRIEQIIDRAVDDWMNDPRINTRCNEHVAQAIVQEFGLRVEGQMGVDGEDPIWQGRVAGKWEVER